MIVYKREPTVENVIEFVARFATSFQSPPKTDEEEQHEDEEEEEDAEDDHPFLSFIFNFLLEVWTLFHRCMDIKCNYYDGVCSTVYWEIKKKVLYFW